MVSPSAHTYLQLFSVAETGSLHYTMSRRDKLIDRFLSKPKDFTWQELVKLLGIWGYKPISMGKTGGSRVRFIHDKYPPIVLHKPHPSSILKPYQIEAIAAFLKQEKIL